MVSQEIRKITHLVGLLHALIKNISKQIRVSIKMKKIRTWSIQFQEYLILRFRTTSKSKICLWKKLHGYAGKITRGTMYMRLLPATLLSVNSTV